MPTGLEEMEKVKKPHVRHERPINSCHPSSARPRERILRRRTLLAFIGCGFYVFASLAPIIMVAGPLQECDRKALEQCNVMHSQGRSHIAGDDLPAHTVYNLELTTDDPNEETADTNNGGGSTQPNSLMKRRMAIPTWAVILVVILAVVAAIGFCFCLAAM